MPASNGISASTFLFTTFPVISLPSSLFISLLFILSFSPFQHWKPQTLICIFKLLSSLVLYFSLTHFLSRCPSLYLSFSLFRYFSLTLSSPKNYICSSSGLRRGNSSQRGRGERGKESRARRKTEADSDWKGSFFEMTIFIWLLMTIFIWILMTVC